MRAIYLLAFGAFLVGTENFLIAGLLPGIAKDFGVSISRAGMLVVIYAALYAVGSPLLAAVTNRIGRRALLMILLVSFALFALFSAVAPSFWVLVGARALLALTTGTYLPVATACACSVEPDRQGKAISMIASGSAMAAIAGVPIGTALGNWLGWRATYVGMAGVALLIALILYCTLPVISGSANVNVRKSFALITNRGIVAALAVTFICAAGCYVVYPYIAAIVQHELGASPIFLEILLMGWGIAGLFGTLLAGNFAHKLEPSRAMAVIMIVLMVVMILFSIAYWVPAFAALYCVIAAMLLWGLFGWSYSIFQQLRLIAAAPAQAAALMSLNASANYIGVASGAALGSAVIAAGSMSHLGWVAALCQAISLSLLLYTARWLRSPSSVSAA